MSLLTLARLSLLEILRQRYALLPVLLAIGLALAGSLPNPTMMVNGMPVSPDPKQLLQVAYGLLTLAGMGLGALVGAGLLAPEIERGTVLLLVTKPVSRAGVVLGKALGALAFLVACFAAWGLVLAVLVAWHATPALAPTAFLGALAGVPSAALLLGVAMACSARLPSGGAMALTFCAWALAGIASAMRNLSWEQLPLLVRVGREAAWLVPWTDMVQLPNAVFGPAPGMLTWAGLIAIPAWAGVAIGLFARRDLG